jgi:hypothetical protein
MAYLKYTRTDLSGSSQSCDGRFTLGEALRMTGYGANSRAKRSITSRLTGESPGHDDERST